ncbi:MAG: peroxide stress protein YaaA [Acidimicrobiales bacterium]
MLRPFVLLPPSQAKQPGGRVARAGDSFGAELGAARDQVREALADVVVRASPSEGERVFAARGATLERASVAARALAEGRAPVRPAHERYCGVVWTHLEASSLTPAQRRRVLVPSGLYGVTSAQDLIADYRLTMSVDLTPLGRLDAFWRGPVSAVVADATRASTVVTLLPREHARALDPAVLAAASRVIDVAFVTPDGARAAGHAAKAVKGVLARQLLEDGVAALEDFAWRGWRVGRRDEGTGAETVTVLAPA